RFLGANHSALDMLGMSGAALRMNSVTALLGTPVAAFVDHFRSPMAPPLPLHLPDGRLVHVQARFDWPTWHHLGSAAEGEEGEPAGVADKAMPAPVAGTPRAATVGSSALSGLRYLQTGDAQMEAVIGKVRRVLNRDISVLVLG